jgi:hypothetical protein
MCVVGWNIKLSAFSFLHPNFKWPKTVNLLIILVFKNSEMSDVLAVLMNWQDLRNDAVTIGVRSLHFQYVNSSLNTEQSNPSEISMFTNYHGVISQLTWIFRNPVVIILKLTSNSYFVYSEAQYYFQNRVCSRSEHL